MIIFEYKHSQWWLICIFRTDDDILYDVDWQDAMNVAWNIFAVVDYVRWYPVLVEHVCAYLVRSMRLDKSDIVDFEDQSLMIDIDFLEKKKGKKTVRHM